MAISHLSSGQEISDIVTETSEEAKACRRFYETALKKTLRAHDWGFARRTVSLGLVTDFGALTGDYEYTYSYRYPSDAVEIRKIKSGVRNDTRQSRVPFKIYSDDSGRLIYTDQSSAGCVYTKYVTDTLLFNDDFILAFSYLLASLIAPRLTGGDLVNNKQRMYEMFLLEISEASANSHNEEQDDELPVSEFERSRA